MKLAERVSTLTPSSTLAITAKAKELTKQGYRVIGFGAGEPDFNTPEHIIEAAYHAMLKGFTKYTPSAGILELRQAIANKLFVDNGLTYKPQEIIVTNGAKHALYNIFQVVLNPGDEVIVPIPYWVSYTEQIKLAGGIPVLIKGEESNEFKITAEQLERAITSKTKVFLLNSPSNPTGTVYSKAELERIAEICVKYDLLVISDEIYEKLIYDDVEHVSIASLNDEIFRRTIVVNGVSKPYAMTGWRIGYAAGNINIIKAMNDLSSHSTSNPTSFAQYASIAAITGTQEPLKQMNEAFKKRRNAVDEWVKKMSQISTIKPKGAFYYFFNLFEVINNNPQFKSVDQWVERLLEEEKVAVIPGSSFGADNYIRISFATSLENINEGLNRIQRFIEKYNV